MGFPPPPHNGPQPPPEQGGGFGPPQGFGPPPPPGDGYGPPPPPGDGFGPPPPPADGYGYPQQGGYGPSGPPGPPMPPGGAYGYPGGGYPGGFPPPQPPPNHTKRNVWIAVGAVAVVGAIVGVVAASSSGGGSDKPSAKDTSRPSISAVPTMPTVPTPTFTLPTDFPSLDLPTDFPSSSDKPEPSATDGEEMPYVVVDPGKCFNAPSMTPGIDTVQTVSCTSAHDAQAIANKTLTGTFTTEDQIEKKAFSLCEADANRHAPAGGDYYSYVLFPQLITYQLQGRNTVTCSLTVNDGTNGKKLHSKLS